MELRLGSILHVSTLDQLLLCKTYYTYTVTDDFNNILCHEELENGMQYVGTIIYTIVQLKMLKTMQAFI